MFLELQRAWMGQKAGAIIDRADADAKPLTDGGVARAVAHDPLSPLMTKAIGAMLDGMQKPVDAAIDKALADVLWHGLLTSETVPQLGATVPQLEVGNRATTCGSPWSSRVLLMVTMSAPKKFQQQSLPRCRQRGDHPLAPATNCRWANVGPS